MLRMGVIQRCVYLPNSSLGLIYKERNGVANQQIETSFQETGLLEDSMECLKVRTSLNCLSQEQNQTRD
jgi:hypothetical protein